VDAFDSALVPSPTRTTVTTGTQLPVPSHAVPPLWLHGVPAASAGFEATPFVHVSAVHTLPSTGKSVSSAALTTLPAPSQTLTRQSPAVCGGAGVPAAAKATPHTPASHVRVAQVVSVPGQSLAVWHAVAIVVVVVEVVAVDEVVVDVSSVVLVEVVVAIVDVVVDVEVVVVEGLLVDVELLVLVVWLVEVVLLVLVV